MFPPPFSPLFGLNSPGVINKLSTIALFTGRPQIYHQRRKFSNEQRPFSHPRVRRRGKNGSNLLTNASPKWGNGLACVSRSYETNVIFCDRDVNQNPPSMKFHFHSLVLLTGLFLISCKKEQKKSPQTPTDASATASYSKSVNVYDESGKFYVSMRLTSNDEATLEQAYEHYSTAMLDLLTKQPVTFPGHLRAEEPADPKPSLAIQKNFGRVKALHIEFDDVRIGNAIGFGFEFPVTKAAVSGYNIFSFTVPCRTVWTQSYSGSYADVNVLADYGSGYEMETERRVYINEEHFWGSVPAKRQFIFYRPATFITTYYQVYI